MAGRSVLRLFLLFSSQRTDSSDKLVGLIQQGNTARTATVVPYTVSGVFS